MKKLIVSICTLALSAIMLCSSTYAWFSMNKTVSANGLTVEAKVSSNLFIDDYATGSWKTNDSTFNSAVSVDSTSVTKLAPVSTIDGKTFFFADPDNVKGDGSVKTNTYLSYDANTLASKYGEGSTGYVDYTFVLKAQNTDTTTQNVILKTLKLKYNDKASDSNKAYRVAVIYREFETAEENGAKTDPNAATEGTSVLYAPTGFEHYSTGKAVAATADNALQDVTYVSTKAAMATVAANTTKYYSVVVRLWLEGEDKTCNVEKFKTLTSNWTLSVEFELADNTNNAVTALTME